jgi:hypothetical protein
MNHFKDQCIDIFTYHLIHNSDLPKKGNKVLKQMDFVVHPTQDFTDPANMQKAANQVKENEKHAKYEFI